MAMIKCRTIRFVFRSGFLLAILVLSLVGPDRTNAQTWSLVPGQSDEFNGPANTPIDTTKWHFDYGNLNVNSELEWYCGPVGDPQNAAPCDPTKANVFIDGSGHLAFQAFRINNNLVNGSWTSGRMQTHGTMTFQYGRLEASMQLPVGAGLWPAFWALGSNIFNNVPWPNCGEMDFMENVPASGGLGPTKIRSTIHGPGYSGASGLGQDFIFPGGVDVTTFHTYGGIWSPNMVQFYVDAPTNVFFIRTASDVPGGSSQWVFNHPFINITNLAVGGNFPGNPDLTTQSPAVMLVDYIRYYQAAAVQAPTLGNPPSISVKAGATTGNSSTFTPGLTSGTGFVFFSCNTNSPKSSCSVATNDPLNTHVANSSPSGAAETVTVTVTTTANSMAPPTFFGPWLLSRLLMAIVAFFVLLLLMLALRSQNRARRQLCGVTAVLILVAAAIAGCGGNSVTTTPPPVNNGTPPGSYVVTVYAFTESNTGDGTNPTADANVAIPLTVN